MKWTDFIFNSGNDYYDSHNKRLEQLKKMLEEAEKPKVTFDFNSNTPETKYFMYDSGGIKEMFNVSFEDFENFDKMHKQFKPKEKDWKSVLKQEHISIRHIFCKKCIPQEQFFIYTPDYDLPIVKVPQSFIDEYPQNETELVYSHVMQRMVETFVRFEDYIINRCIKEAIFFHPIDELRFTIDINS